MRFEVLGPLNVTTDDGSSVAVPEPKVRALLACLLVRHGRPVPVDRLIDDLWGEDAMPGNPGNSLQTKVSQLRRTLEKAEPGARALVEYGPAGYALRVADEAVDAARFGALAARARAAGDERTKVVLLADALGLWRGDAYADFRDAGFVRAEAARLEEQRLTVGEELAELRLALGEHRSLADELAGTVADHPLRERLRAVHIRALYRAGRPTEALDSYHDLKRRLADELGLDPGAELTALHQAVLEQDPALAPGPDGPAAADARPPRTNLPAPVTGLVGREDAVARVCELAVDGRLVTLTGPGGVGKTRLALEAAARLTDAFADGVWLVELAGARSGEAVPAASAASAASAVSVVSVVETVAAALGIRDDTAPGVGVGVAPGPASAPRAALDRLAGAIGTRRLLLVLDNCEHVVEQVAALAEQLLRRAPGLHIIATSQEPLAIAGEMLDAVAPLAEADAVRLFAARAAAAAPGFVLDDGNTEAVALICRRLDGIPLALELAATRVRALGVHALSDRLHDRFRLLNQVRRDAPARQRTLRAMIDWSWELLTGPERSVLRRLAVFRGGFGLDAAEAVCAAEDVRTDEVLDIVTRLVDRSLVVTVDGTYDTYDARYRMLESVTAYSRERLEEADESLPVRLRHAAHCADLLERTEPRLYGPDQRRSLRTLDSETANVRAALDTAVEQGDAALALRLVNAMSWYWFLRGRLGEACRALDLALGCAGGPARDRAGAGARRAAFALLTGDDSLLGETFDAADPRARWLLEIARCGFEGEAAEDNVQLAGLLAEFRSGGDRWGVAAVLSARATRAGYRGDLPALRAGAEESAALFGELGDRWGQLRSSEHLGVLAEIAGSYEEAARLHQEGVRSAQELELWTDVSFRLARLGRVALLTGDDARATDYHERARRLAAEQSHGPAEQFAETGLALGARRRGDLDTAEKHLLPWLEWNRRLGVDSGAALILAQLGYVAEQRGDAEGALALHREGLAAARRTEDPRAVALALEGLAGAHAAAGAATPAAELLGTAAALRASVDASLPPAERADVDRAAARARAVLGEAAFTEAMSRGRTSPPESHG